MLGGGPGHGVDLLDSEVSPSCVHRVGALQAAVAFWCSKGPITVYVRARISWEEGRIRPSEVGELALSGSRAEPVVIRLKSVEFAWSGMHRG